MRYPAQIMPCDQIISRCFREVDRRLLTVHDIWKVRSLKHQVTTSRKRKQVGDGLYTFEEEAYADPAHTVSAYLAKLHTYLLALAITGSVKNSDAPQEENLWIRLSQLCGSSLGCPHSVLLQSSQVSRSHP